MARARSACAARKKLWSCFRLRWLASVCGGASLNLEGSQGARIFPCGRSPVVRPENRGFAGLSLARDRHGEPFWPISDVLSRFENAQSSLARGFAPWSELEDLSWARSRPPRRHDWVPPPRPLGAPAGRTYAWSPEKAERRRQRRLWCSTKPSRLRRAKVCAG